MKKPIKAPKQVTSGFKKSGSPKQNLGGQKSSNKGKA